MLPIFEIQDKLLTAVRNTGTAVLTAPTGSGKSTQVPVFLSKVCPNRILVLQPRRLAARMLAERVAQENGSRLGEFVGFQNRYEHAFSKKTKILFITEGILTKMLLSSPDLPGISCIVFDEFHERSIHADLGLAMAWRARCTQRPDLKIVVMSATLDATPISSYLGQAPVIQAEGRLFPVDLSYCEPLVKQQGPVLAAARTLREFLNAELPGDVLIFMPGSYEIHKTIEACRRMPEPLLLLPLYGNLPPEEQRKVMEPAPVRKVIVATNIAETSLTIPGVRLVIDSGLARISRYDPARGINTLETMPIARDAAEQRAGRGGREAPGICRRLWTWMEQSAKPSRTLPEIQRMDLADALLAIHAFHCTDPEQFPWFEKPPRKMIEHGEKLLHILQLVEKNGELSVLGQQLCQVPAHPRIALLLWLGTQKGCPEETAWAAALLTERPLFSGTTRELQKHDEKRHQNQNQSMPVSDFLISMELARAAKEHQYSQDFCDRFGIQPGAARDIVRAAEDYTAVPRRLGWQPSPVQENREKAFLQCILQAFPDRLARRLDTGSGICLMAGGRRGELSRNTAVRDQQLLIATDLRETAIPGSQSTKILLSLCSGIEEEWLLDLFPDAWDETDETFWDDRKEQVVRHQTLSCLGVLMEDKIRTDLDEEKAARILADQLVRGKIQIPNWDDQVLDWINRSAWVAEIFPEENLPAYDEAGKQKILQNLCWGENSLKKLRNKPTLEYVKNLMSRHQQQFIERMAPSFLLLPNGRKMKLHYLPGQQPKGSAKIYDLYDLPDLPVIASGRAKVLLDILAPNFRTVQITDDLAGFWRDLYPKVKPELARRYPRHPWR